MAVDGGLEGGAKGRFEVRKRCLEGFEFGENRKNPRNLPLLARKKNMNFFLKALY